MIEEHVNSPGLVCCKSINCSSGHKDQIKMENTLLCGWIVLRRDLPPWMSSHTEILADPAWVSAQRFRQHEEP